MQIVIDLPKETYENALNDWLCGSAIIINAIKNGTPLSQEPKTGHWINMSENSAICSCCGRTNLMIGYYCKWCGARMCETLAEKDAVTKARQKVRDK